MEQVISNVATHLDIFILIFLRASALIISSPVFGRRNLPNIIKICFCILLTYVLFTAYNNMPQVKFDGILEYAILCIKELLFGLALGYVTTLFFSIAQTAGYIIDMQMGFGMVSVFDVQSNISVPMTGNFLNIVLLITFFGVNGHLQLIRILQATFSKIPVGTVTLNPQIGMTALEVFVLAFVLAINVAMPMIASGLVGEVIMGFIVRAVPQMNVFVVGIPLKILLGFMILLLVLPVFVSFSDTLFQQMYLAIEKMFRGFAV
jgi:flagellar biosynthetic protein FliR